MHPRWPFWSTWLVEIREFADVVDLQSLWVPNRSSMSGDLGVFVYQPAESVAALEV
jgi:hypothetical protein